MPALIETHRLSKSFDARPVIDDLNLVVETGRALGFLGPNGSGKTTTLRLLTGLLRPTSGSVHLFGTEVTAKTAPQLRSRIGVQTDAALYEGLTVLENLRIWADLFAMPRRQREARIDEVLTILEFTERAHARVGSLSKGQRQKAAIARAIVHDPELVLLDEPTAGLDPEATADLIEYLARLKAERARTIVVCTHQLHGLERLCDDLAVISRGRLIAAGTVESLLAERWPTERVNFVFDHETVALDLADAEIPEVVAKFVGQGRRIHAVERRRRSIHELYFELVGGHRS